MKVNSPSGGGAVHVFKRRRHCQRIAAHLPFDFRQILLRHGELDVNRMDLVDGQQHVVRRLDDVAFVKIAGCPSRRQTAHGYRRNSRFNCALVMAALSAATVPCRVRRTCWCRIHPAKSVSGRTIFVRGRIGFLRIPIARPFRCARQSNAACVGRGSIVNSRSPLFDLLAFLEMHFADDAADLRMDGHR